MKQAKKRYFFKEPKFWKILKHHEPKRQQEINAGFFYCPYVPLLSPVSPNILTTKILP